MKLTLNLQLFADGGASAGASQGAGATTGENSAIPSPVGNNKTAETKIVYGKQEAPSSSETQTQQTQRLSFEDLVKSEDYAEEAKAYMNKHFSKRHAKYKGIEEENAKMRAILETQNMRYGLDPNSATYLDDFAQKLQNDTKFYEDEAAERGMPVEDYMKIKQAEQLIAQNQRNEQTRQKNEAVQAHIRNLLGQAEAMKADFPNFDIETEMANPNFKRLVDTPELGGAGISVRDAFYALHHNEIMKSTVNNAVNQAQIKTANAVATNKSRPTENGLTKAPTVVVKDDPSKFNLEDFRRIKDEMLRTGKGIKF